MNILRFIAPSVYLSSKKKDILFGMSILEEQTLKILNDGTKEYTLPSYFLSEESMLGASYIHYWTRYCDEAVNGRYNETVQSLKIKTQTMTAHSPLSPPFEALKQVMQKYYIPFHYPLEFLEGLGMKMNRVRIKTYKELDLYCYRVASTRGLMMAHVMGITNEVALKSIRDLAIAIELISIANNIKSDLRHGQCYIPLEALGQFEMKSEDLLKRQYEKILFFMIFQIVKRANSYFVSGIDCIEYFPVRSGLMIYILANLEKETGQMIFRQPEVTPVKLSFFKKFYIVTKSFFEYFYRYFPKRINQNQINKFSKTMKFD